MTTPTTPGPNSNNSGPAGTPAAAPGPAGGGAPAAVVAPGSPKPLVSFEEFAKLDLRVAKVVKAELHPKADKLLKLQVDDGSGTPRQICAGIREQYTPEQMEGRLIVIVANLAPRVIRGEESRGMLLAASDVPKDAVVGGAARKVVVVGPTAEIGAGAVVS